MPRYIFIVHDGDLAIDRKEYDLPSDTRAVEFAIASSRDCEIDLWRDDVVVATAAYGAATLKLSAQAGKIAKAAIPS